MEIPRAIVPILVAACFFQVANAADSLAGKNCGIEGERDGGAAVARLMLAGVPAIVRLPESITKPPIILWHGFGPPASESDLMAALPLDDVPALKVYLGLPMFGTRAPEREEDSLARRQAQDYASRLFEPIVVEAAQELPRVVQALVEKGCLARSDSIGLLGFSAGGTAVLLALAERRVPVRAAVTLNAPVGLRESIDALERATKTQYVWAPAVRRLAEGTDSVHRAADLARGSPPPALLLFHGAEDKVVTSTGAVSLERALRPFYHKAEVDGRLQLQLAQGVSHNWSDPRVREAVRVVVADWFNRNL